MTTAAHEEIRIGELEIRVLLDGEAANGSLALFEFDVPAGAQYPPPHSHDGYEETVRGLRGTLTWTIDGARVEIGEGDVLHIPRGVVHRFENESGSDATQLAVVTPGILSPDYFRELAALVNGATTGPPDPAEFAAIMRRHGLTPA